MSGQVAAQGLSLVRNIVVARLLSPEDFGIAAMFVLTFSLMEMASSFSVDKLLVQSDQGDDEAFQATAHTFQAAKGLFAAVATLILAWPIARLFGVPEAAWAFACIALVPLARGFVHLDMKRFHRKYNFGSDVTAELVSQTVALTVAWPMAWWLQSYSAMVWILLSQAMALVLASHVIAERQYQLKLVREHIGDIVRFGWPLVFNALLIYVTLTADRFMVGVFYEPRDLGIYAVAFALAMMPANMLARVNGSIFLPMLSARKYIPARFVWGVRLSSGTTTLAAVVFATLLITAGPYAIVILYGPAYEESTNLIAWFAVMFAIRLMRGAASEAALAQGNTKNHMYANIWRNSALAGMFVVAWFQLPLMWLPIVGIIGELLGMCAAAVLLRWQRIVPISSVLGFPALGMTALVATLALHNGLYISGDWVRTALIASVVMAFNSGMVGVPLLLLLRNREGGSMIDLPIAGMQETAPE